MLLADAVEVLPDRDLSLFTDVENASMLPLDYEVNRVGGVPHAELTKHPLRVEWTHAPHLLDGHARLMRERVCPSVVQSAEPQDRDRKPRVEIDFLRSVVETRGRVRWGRRCLLGDAVAMRLFPCPVH